MRGGSTRWNARESGLPAEVCWRFNLLLEEREDWGPDADHKEDNGPDPSHEEMDFIDPGVAIPLELRATPDIAGERNRYKKILTQVFEALDAA